MVKSLIYRFYCRMVIYFYYTAKPNYINPIFYFRLINENHKKKKLRKNKKLWDLLQSSITKSSSGGCEYSDLYYLYSYVKDNSKIKNVLELGSGISSMVLAFVCKELKEEKKPYPKIISMEESIEYQKDLYSWFPSELNEFIEFHHSRRVEDKKNNTLVCFYEEIPNFPYDFIFIDGPSLHFNGVKSCNYDLFNIILKNKKKKFTAWLDQRVGTYWYYRKNLKNALIKYSATTRLAEITIYPQVQKET